MIGTTCLVQLFKVFLANYEKIMFSFLRVCPRGGPLDVHHLFAYRNFGISIVLVTHKIIVHHLWTCSFSQFQTIFYCLYNKSLICQRTYDLSMYKGQYGLTNFHVNICRHTILQIVSTLQCNTPMQCRMLCPGKFCFLNILT